jgi:hypothetical protein
MALRHPHSRTERSNATTWRLFFIIVCIVSFSFDALSQDTQFSADSLMAAFDKNPQSSLRGSQITLTGVIAEIKKSSVVFRSSRNDKVICELVSSSGNGLEGHRLGSPLTVVGKVRGRGVLGNITLDQCKAVVTEIASNEPAPVELPPEPTEQHEPATTEVLETAPVLIANAVPKISGTPVEPVPRALFRVDAPNEPISSNKVEEPNGTTATSVQRSEVAHKDSNSFQIDSCAVYQGLVLAFVGIGALVSAVKLRGRIASRRTPSQPTTEAARRAAIAALLSKQKMQK